jgi:hypothetical protein
LKLVGWLARETVEARHALASEARGVAIITGKSRLDCDILRVHALEESTLSIVELIGAVNTLRAEVPRGASTADSLAGLADLFEVVGEVTTWAI